MERIASRISRANPLNGSIEEIISNYNRLESNFLSFFPDLIDFTRSYCASVQYPSTLLPEDGALRTR